jgi:hypothetical protein
VTKFLCMVGLMQVLTALAFSHFAREKVDLAVVEVQFLLKNHVFLCQNIYISLVFLSPKRLCSSKLLCTVSLVFFLLSLFMFFSFLFLSLFLCSSFFLVSFISPSLLGFYWDSQHHDFLSYDS